MDRSTGELKERPFKLNQPIIKEYLGQQSLKLNHNFKSFKQLLIWWIVYYYITFF